MKKIKVYLTKMNTEIGPIPVLSNWQRVNRPTKIYSAERHINDGVESIFFIVRHKDANMLESIGYTIQSIILMPGFTARLIGAKLEQSYYF